MAVYFHTEGISFSLKEKRSKKKWIKSVAENNDHRIGNINYIFCSDEELLTINAERLNHHYYTDIITFDLSDKAALIEGDIYISIDRVRENAAQLKTTFDQELNRVIIHGILHLLGFQDKTNKEQQEMRAEEDRCITQLNSEK